MFFLTSLDHLVSQRSTVSAQTPCFNLTVNSGQCQGVYVLENGQCQGVYVIENGQIQSLLIPSLIFGEAFPTLSVSTEAAHTISVERLIRAL